jgi:hypothetical protein
MKKAAAALLALGLAASQARAAPSPDSPAVIPLKPYLGALWSFDGVVGGREGLFLLDTAGGVTVVTPAQAEAAGCKPWGQLTGFRMRGDRVDTPRCDGVTVTAAGTKLEVPTAGVFDIGKLLPPGAPPLAGSMALDAFAGRAVTLDLAHRRLIVETPQSLAARVRGAVEVPVRFSREMGGVTLTPMVAVETPAGRAWMELDSGSDAAVIVDRHVAAPLGLDPNVKTAQLLDAKLAGGVALHGRALVQDLILDGNIGLPVLARWAVTLDLARQKAWIAPADEAAGR